MKRILLTLALIFFPIIGYSANSTGTVVLSGSQVSYIQSTSTYKSNAVINIGSGTIRNMNVSTFTINGNRSYTNSVINVKDFGAKGDGVTDDTNAIKTAFINGEGKTIYFPSGTYNFTGATIPASCNITGDGMENTTLNYIPASGVAITLGGRYVTIRDLKIASANHAIGYAIFSPNDTPITDFIIENYSLENFSNGLWIPYCLHVHIGFGRINGIVGGEINNTVGIRLGTAIGSHIVNAAEIEEAYVSWVTTAIYVVGGICNAEGLVVEASTTAIFLAGRMFVSGSYLSADKYVFSTSTDGAAITAWQNYNQITSVGEVGDLTPYVLLGKKTDLAAFGKTDLLSPAPYRFQMQTEFERGLVFSSTEMAIFDNNKTLNVKTINNKEPFAVDRSTFGNLIGLKGMNGLDIAHIGVNSSSETVITSPDGSNWAIRISTTGNVMAQGAVGTTSKDGYIYIPSCAGTPTGVPRSYPGLIPLVVDSIAHKLYFYDGGWRDAGP